MITNRRLRKIFADDITALIEGHQEPDGGYDDPEEFPTQTFSFADLLDAS